MYLIRNEKTGEVVKKEKYPARDEDRPVVGLGEDLTIYKLKDVKPLHNDNVEFLFNKGYLFTEETYNAFIKIAKIDYEVVACLENEVVEKLNLSLGAHLDSLYPFWEQNKHSGKAIRYIHTLLAGGTPDQTDTDYITSKVLVLADWAKRCRDARDLKEKEFIKRGKVPAFEWEPRPIL